ncbi:MAG: SDR family oxidoreductase [Verrucomicrobia bacterium]|jgi:pteridine reductase|nr:SDR family oxidoreductase [Verrucomicrobiota bacterium]
MDLEGKRVLITGGAVRIGRAISEALSASGCVVAVHYWESEQEATGLVDTLRRSGERAFSVRTELNSESACAGLVEESAELMGGMDALINNAAVFHRDDFLDTTEAKLRSEMATNAFAPIFLTQAFARVAERGKIINLLDQRVVKIERGALAYQLSKRLLADFTQIAALELAPRFTVNAVAPGPILPPPGEGPDRTRELAGSTPLQSPLAPEDVARAVLYLLESDAVTGQTIFVDGGQRLGKAEMGKAES